VVQNSRFGFELEDWADLKGINSAIYADDEELGGERIRDQRALGCLNKLLYRADVCLYVISEMHVGGTHLKYGLPDGGIVVVRPDGYGTSSIVNSSLMA
jgi:hypothetical protein